MQVSRLPLPLSVFVIVRRGTEVLLLRRAHTGWKDGCHSVPAGRLERGETLVQAAVRELREETGLHASVDQLDLAHFMHCRQGRGGSAWLGAFFLTHRWWGEAFLAEPQKHDELRWCEPGSFPDSMIDYVRQGIELSLAGRRFSDHGWV